MDLIRFSAALALWAAAAGTLAAESGHGGHTRSAAQRRIPHEVVARPVPLRSGIGTLKDPVTTTSPQAQAFYQQGMSYLHTYGWIEAARSFNQALRMDPGLAPAWIGLGRAMYQLDDTEAAQAAVAEAKKLSPKVTPREQRRIAIFAAGLEASIDQDSVEKEKAYLDAIETALAADPEDPELWLIRGNATEGPDGIGMGGGASAIAFYEAALHRASDHAGANHYLIHAFESIGKIPEAVKYGEIFARLAPQSPHAHHMYGHNLRRAGRVEEATREFETAYNLEMAYYARENILPEYDWHHPHNLSLLAMAYQYQGRLRDAERVLGQLFALEPVTPFIQFNRKALPEYLLVRGRPEEALKAAGDLAQGKYRFGRVGGHAMAGLAYVALGKAEEAEDELLAAEDEEDETVSPYVEILDAALLLKGDEAERDEAATILRNSMAEIRAIPGPDAWMLALFRLELIAGIARHAKEWDLAEDAARQMLEHDSAYPGAHFALALVLEQKGDAPHARKEFLEAERLWRHADPDLPELKAIKSRRA